MEPLVSICCITYNQVNFISEAIEGFLIQKTSFPMEIIIHDDASTDGTAEIIRSYERKYPNLIKPIYQTENKFSQGLKVSATYVWPKARGKYIALCEGDDYWIDPSKLQSQVDFLENNPGFTIAFHNTRYLFEDGREEYPNKYDKDIYTIEDLFEKNFIATASCIFRKKNVDELPTWFYKLPFGDWSLHFINAQFGKIKYIDKVMAVYRIHSGGMWSGTWASATPEKTIEVVNHKIRLYNFLDIYFNKKYSKIIQKQKMKLYYKLLNFYLGNKIVTSDNEIIRYCLKNNFFNPDYSKKKILSGLKKLLSSKLS